MKFKRWVVLHTWWPFQVKPLIKFHRKTFITIIFINIFAFTNNYTAIMYGGFLILSIHIFLRKLIFFFFGLLIIYFCVQVCVFGQIIGKEKSQGGNGPRSGRVPVEMGLGGRKYSVEEIGPRPGRVPGLFHQKGESIIYILIYSLLLCTFTFCVCVSGKFFFVLAATEFILIGKEIPQGGKWARAREGPS